MCNARAAGASRAFERPSTWLRRGADDAFRIASDTGCFARAAAPCTAFTLLP